MSSPVQAQHRNRLRDKEQSEGEKEEHVVAHIAALADIQKLALNNTAAASEDKLWANQQVPA